MRSVLNSKANGARAREERLCQPRQFLPLAIDRMAEFHPFPTVLCEKAILGPVVKNVTFRNVGKNPTNLENVTNLGKLHYEYSPET